MIHPCLKYLFPQTKAITIDPNGALVFAIYGPEGTDQHRSGAWAFILDPIDVNSTRLISRLQVGTSSLVGKMIFYGFMEMAHFVMQQGMFNGLNERLERTKLESDDI